MEATTLNAWKHSLRQKAEGLDFNEEEDRVTFRLRVLIRCHGVRVDLLRALSRELGNAMPPTTRAGAATALANTYIVHSQLGDARLIPSDENISESLYAEQAGAIARLATALEHGTVQGPRHAAVRRLADMVAVLQVWTPDDRS